MTPASHRMGRRDECMTSEACWCLVWVSCWIIRVGWIIICCLFWRKWASAIKQKQGWSPRRQPRWKENLERGREHSYDNEIFILFFILHSTSPAFYHKKSKPHWKNNSSLNILLGISTGLFKPLLLFLFLHWRFNTVSFLWVIHVFYAAGGDINQKRGMPSNVWGALLPPTAQGGYRRCDLIAEGTFVFNCMRGEKKGMLKNKKVRGAVLNSG